MPVTYIAEYSLAGGRAIMLCNVKCSSEPSSLLGERYTESRAVHRSIEHIASRLAAQEYVPEQSLVVTSGHSSAEVPPRDMQRGASTAPSEDGGPPPWSTSTPGTSPSCTARTEHGDEEMQSYSPSVHPPIAQPIARETFFILTDADVVRRRAMFLCLQGDDLDERQAFELLQRAMICEPTPSALAALLFEGQVVEGQVLQDSTMLGGNNTPEGKQSPEMVYFPSSEQGDGEGPREFDLILMRQKVQRQEIMKLLIWGGGALVVVIIATIFTLLAVCETDFSLCVN